MQRCVLAANGSWINPSWHREQIQEQDFLIGIDQGAERLRQLGFWPQLVIGDFDSLRVRDLQVYQDQGSEILVYPPEKDLTDTQLCLNWIQQQGFKEVLFLGAFGGRIDHFFSILFSLVPLVQAGISFQLRDPQQSLFFAPSPAQIQGEPGQIVSLLAFTEVQGVSTKGLKYPLTHADLHLYHPYAISNELISTQGEVSWKRGVLAIYTQTYGWDENKFADPY